MTKDAVPNKVENQAHPKPLEAQLEKVISPFHSFIKDQSTASILLIICTVIALIIANSPLSSDYEKLLHLETGFVFADWDFKMSIRHWINDGLMSIFFFILGLEIKREILVGDLKDPQQSLPVIAAALGGMLVPAAIYFAFNYDTPNAHGWGTTMATDTAFAVGILALLGKRIPLALITFLTALAIIDDLGAILVIAVFYTQTIDIHLLGTAAIFLLGLILCNASGCRRPIVYIMGGIVVWLAMLGSGVHATVAGILVAMTIPARPKRDPAWFVDRTRNLVDEFEDIEKNSATPILGEEQQHEVVELVQDSAEKASTPLRRWERALEHPVALFIMPVFALANAGIPINLQALGNIASDKLSLGIILGLVFGKSMGITLLAWLALRLKLGRLAKGVTLQHILGIGLLGGMGFTMSIFISGLSFGNSPETLVTAKTAILLASLVAGLSGYLWLRLRN